MTTISKDVNMKGGGPAFPTTSVHAINADAENAKITAAFTPAGFPGMDIRDYFAAKAMQALVLVNELHTILTGLSISKSSDDDANVLCTHLDFDNLIDDDLASNAYCFADAMLKARQS